VSGPDQYNKISYKQSIHRGNLFYNTNHTGITEERSLSRSINRFHGYAIAYNRSIKQLGILSKHPIIYFIKIISATEKYRCYYDIIGDYLNWHVPIIPCSRHNPLTHFRCKCLFWRVFCDVFPLQRRCSWSANSTDKKERARHILIELTLPTITRSRQLSTLLIRGRGYALAERHAIQHWYHSSAYVCVIRFVRSNDDTLIWLEYLQRRSAQFEPEVMLIYPSQHLTLVYVSQSCSEPLCACVDAHQCVAS